jgi:hypothetical protein
MSENDNEYIIKAFDRVHSKLDKIETKVNGIDSINTRLIHVEKTYSRRIDWKNFWAVIVSFCAILSVMVGVATVYK